MEGFYIGELAKRAQTPTKTIRYYEELGLLTDAKRSPSGYRVYSDDDIERLRFIQGAKALGLSLAEVKRIVDVWASGAAPCSQVSQLLDDKLAELDRRIADLTAFRDSLVAYRARVENTERPSNVPCVHIAGVEAGLWEAMRGHEATADAKHGETCSSSRPHHSAFDGQRSRLDVPAR